MHSIDRKSLKKPDLLLFQLKRFFQFLSQATILWLVLGIVVIFIGLGVSYFSQSRQKKESLANHELFQVDVSFREESKNKTDGTSLEQKFPSTLEKLKKIPTLFPSTRAALEAQFRLGSLYFEHGQFSDAEQWFTQATLYSSHGLDKAFAFSSLAYTYENLKNYPKAIEFFQKALAEGEASLKGDLLLGLARCYEAHNDLAQAKKTYAQIIQELPETQYAQSAELYQQMLE